MLSLASSALALLALATTSNALSLQGLINNCNETVYATFTNSTKSTLGPTSVPANGGIWETEIIGVGNSLGVTKSDKFWTNETAKLIFGTSTDKGILYWTVSHVDGDPFKDQKFAVLSSEGDKCENATT